jgi:carboxymethylenebutenolidase
MLRNVCLVGACLFVVVTVSAQDWAKARIDKSPRHLEWVKVKHDGREVDCFVAYPEVKDKATAVVVIHEIFGLTDWVRGVADQLAEKGYIAIAPDLLTGMGPKGEGSKELGSDGSRRIIGNLKVAQKDADLDAVVEYVSKLPACNGKVAVGGFCWGGGETFRYATHNPNIKAFFPFYGTNPTDEQALAKIQAPVYGFFAGNDMRVNATIPKAEEIMKRLGKTYEPVLYEGAGHGFMRAGEDPNGNAGNKKARDQAWQRWTELLKKI